MQGSHTQLGQEKNSRLAARSFKLAQRHNRQPSGYDVSTRTATALVYLGAHGEAGDGQVSGCQVDDEHVDATVHRTITTARQHHHGNDAMADLSSRWWNRCRVCYIPYNPHKEVTSRELSIRNADKNNERAPIQLSDGTRI